jgi:DNA-binding transcriptional MerR regulator
MNIKHSLAELGEITGLSPRTIRFYMSKGLLDKPLGARKTAYYTDTHLKQLLTVIDCQKEGMSLDEIAQRQLHGDIPQTPIVKPGEVEVIHRIHICDGVELNVDLVKTQLSNKKIRELADKVYQWLAQESVDV